MRADRRFVAGILALALAACGPRAEGPRPIPAGAECARCGMEAGDLRFACEDERGGEFRFYDSIECLLQADPPAGRVWLADYDTRILHAADSVWVVQGNIPSPMGGGFASFASREAADEVARERDGRVARLRDFRLEREAARQP